MKSIGKVFSHGSLPLMALGLLPGCFQTMEVPQDASASGEVSLIEEKGPAAVSLQDAAGNRMPSSGKISLDATGAFTREFSLEVPEDGEYYLGAWIDGTPGRDQAVLVDGKIVPGVAFRFKEGGWQSAHAASGQDEARLRLEAGRHTVSVRAAGIAPNVERLILARTPEEAVIPADGYRDYLRRLVETSRPAAKTGAEPFLAKRADDPIIGYAYNLDVPVNYTWYAWVYLTQGVTYEFATGHLSTGADPVLHLFDPSNPSQSWVNDDFAPPDRNAKITVTAPATTSYLLLARAYGTTTGTATVYQSGATLGSACPLAGYRMWAGSPASNQTLNYFTGMKSSSTVDPRIWLFDANDRLRAQNDDYSGGGSFAWGYNSRIKGSFSDISYVLVSAYSTTSTGTADVYSKLPDATDSPNWFPNLNAADAIQSAPEDGTYNCISWSGAVTSTWHWPPGGGNPWYVAGNPLQTFHNFYSNTCASGGVCKRYADANVWKYGNYSSNPAGGIVALWYNATDASYTHASVSKPANGLPHGYDWESKPGGLERTLHPRDALVDNSSGGYGQIVGYYQHTGYTAKAGGDDKPPEIISEKESIKRGNSVLEEPVLFTSEERAALSRAKGRLSKEDLDEFEALFEAWTATFPKHRHQSNPEAYRRGPEFEALAGYCESKGKEAWPLLFEKLEGRNPVVGFAVVSLVKGHDDLLEEAVKEWTENQIRPDGKFVIFSPENARMRFAKKLLAQEL